MGHTLTKAKVALITGSARRIGAEIVRLLHNAGLNIVIHYRQSEESAKNLCQELNSKRAHSAIALPVDLYDIAKVPTFLQEAVREWGQLDVFVNNASCFFKTSVGSITEESWSKLMDCNLKAPFFLSQAAYPYLVKTRGCIVNITDIHTEQPLRDYSVYCISKAGLVAATKALAKEFGPHVRVNAIAPGMICWPEGENVLSDKQKQNIIDESVLKCGGDPQDIAKAVLFFVRDADYVTGQVLMVDGGRLL